MKACLGKLVAGKGEDLKAILVVLVMETLELDQIHCRLTALGADVDHEHNLTQHKYDDKTINVWECAHAVPCSCRC